MITCSFFAPAKSDQINEPVSTTNCRMQQAVEMYLHERAGNGKHREEYAALQMSECIELGERVHVCLPAVLKYTK